MKEGMESVKHSSVAAWFHCGKSRERGVQKDRVGQYEGSEVTVGTLTVKECSTALVNFSLSVLEKWLSSGRHSAFPKVLR